MPVKHYDNDKFKIMPISGRHTICLCGQWMQDSYKPNNKRKTNKIKEVTCKRCIKLLEKAT